MHIISKNLLREFWERHPTAERPLKAWHKVAQHAEWKNLLSVQTVFRDAEAVKNFTVFNIKGNSFRLIVSIDYRKQLIYVKYILTHAEYDKNQWKKDERFQ